MKGKLLSRVRLLATPWTAAYQGSLSMGFSRQEYWSVSLSPVVFPSCSVDFSGVPVVLSWPPVVDGLWSLPFPEFCVVFSVVLFEVVHGVTTLAGFLVTVDLLVVLLRQVVFFLLGTGVVCVSLSGPLSVLVVVSLGSEACLFLVIGPVLCLLEVCSEAGGATWVVELW